MGNLIMSIRNEILRIIDTNRNDAIEFLRKLVKFRSVVGTPYRPIQDVMAKKFREIDLVVDMWEPNIDELKEYKFFTTPIDYYLEGFKDRPVVVGKSVGEGGGRSIIFNGHVEVVTEEPIALWKHDPWGGEIDNGKMYGRGVADCKGGLAAATMALSAVREAGVKLNGDVILESVFDEEIGGTGTIATILKGYHADAAIAVEPNYAVVISSVGVMWFRVTLEGKSAHAAHVWQGVNAINKAMKIHEALNEYGEKRMKTVRRPLFKTPIHATFNPGTFISGGYPSSVPDKAILEYRIATLPGEENEMIFEEIKEVVKRTAERDKWLREHKPKVELFGWYGLPTLINKDHQFIKIISNAYREVTRNEVEYGTATWASDRWRLHHLAKTPTVEFGCNGGGIHQNDEYIIVDDFINLIKTYALLILDWCGIA